MNASWGLGCSHCDGSRKRPVSWSVHARYENSVVELRHYQDVSRLGCSAMWTSCVDITVSEEYTTPFFRAENGGNTEDRFQHLHRRENLAILSASKLRFSSVCIECCSCG